MGNEMPGRIVLSAPSPKYNETIGFQKWVKVTPENV